MHCHDMYGGRLLEIDNIGMTKNLSDIISKR